MKCIVFISIILLYSFHIPLFADMVWPIRLEQRVTGTFGEYRGTHFHHGLDISCDARKGLPIVAADHGYVSSVLYQQWGIGFAVFITHNNGTRTLYGHMNGFAKKILWNKEVKKFSKHIRNRKDFRIDFDKPVLPVKKGQVIGYSGDSGRGHEHLHFEIRDKNNTPVNPLLHGLTVNDTTAPVINTVYLIPLTSNSLINGENKIFPLTIAYKDNTNKPEIEEVPPVVSGKIGLMINTYDHVGYRNKVAPYGYKLFLNNKELWSIRFNKIKRESSHRFGLFYDYDNSNLSTYTYFLFSRTNRNGIIDTDDYDEGEPVSVKIECFDTSGNTAKLSFKLSVKEVDTKREEKKPNLVPGKELSLYNITSFEIKFSKKSAIYKERIELTSDEQFSFKHKGLIQKSKLYTVTPTNLCLDRSAVIKMKYKGKDHKKVGIYKISAKGYAFFRGNNYNEESKTFTIRSSRLGQFILLKDTNAPKILFKARPRRKKIKRIKKRGSIRLYLRDTGSGINLDSIYLRINNKKVNWDYDPDNRCIEILPHNRIWQRGKHVIKIRVKDKAGNSSGLKRFYYKY